VPNISNSFMPKLRTALRKFAMFSIFLKGIVAGSLIFGTAPARTAFASLGREGGEGSSAGGRESAAGESRVASKWADERSDSKRSSLDGESDWTCDRGDATTRSKECEVARREIARESPAAKRRSPRHEWRNQQRRHGKRRPDAETSQLIKFNYARPRGDRPRSQSRLERRPPRTTQG
jgi:hypothetical protein